MQVDEGDQGSWGWNCPLSSVCPQDPRSVRPGSAISHSSFHSCTHSFRRSMSGASCSTAGSESSTSRGSWNTPATLCPQPHHGLGPCPGTGSAASLCFLPERARRGDFIPPCLSGAGVPAAIHHQSNREVSGTISELVVLTLSEMICLSLMKLIEEKKKKEC